MTNTPTSPDEKFCKLGKYSYLWTGTVIFFSLCAVPGIAAIRLFKGDYPLLSLVGAVLLLLAVYLPPFIAIGCTVISYRNRARSLLGLASLYFELIVLFAFIYFLFALLDAQTLHLKGIHQVWWLDPQGEKPQPIFIMENAFYALLDCFHFSVVTAATVGYGDIVPNSPKVKLLVDLQILSSTALVIVGIGNFFSSKDANDA